MTREEQLYGLIDMKQARLDEISQERKLIQEAKDALYAQLQEKREDENRLDSEFRGLLLMMRQNLDEITAISAKRAGKSVDEYKAYLKELELADTTF